MENRFHGLCVCFSGNFGVRSIVLCKSSGKYIDIYFSLEITYSFHCLSFPFLKGCRLERGHIVAVLCFHSLKRKKKEISEFGERKHF